MDAPDRKAELTKAIHAARVEIDKIERAEMRKESVSLLGKHLKYPQNSYSCPQKPSDYWTVYRKILRMDKDGVLHGIEFQKDSGGKITVERCRIYRPTSSGWVPCTKREYERARDRLVDEAHNLFFAP